MTREEREQLFETLYEDMNNSQEENKRLKEALQHPDFIADVDGTIKKVLEGQEPKTGHCKDCKYYHTAWDGTETHYYEDYWCEWAEPNENDFCSLYEPKEEVSE